MRLSDGQHYCRSSRFAVCRAADGPLGREGFNRREIPWYLWCAAAAVTSVTIGGHWDVSWHRSIGRDTFWTPAHLAIYLCGVLAGICCGYLILYTTIRKPAHLVAASVRVLGFQAPLGAFVAAWGGITMLAAAPFDDWWHSAYGLDVKIVSPPHVVLLLGVMMVKVGAILLVLGAMNRSTGSAARKLQWLLLYLGGLMLVQQQFFVMEYTWDVRLHEALPYQILAAIVPGLFAALWLATRNKWASTWLSLIYTTFLIGLILILPLFPAQPRLGPVFQPVTRFLPPKFPLLLLVSALALDLLWTKAQHWKPWLMALASGPVFVLTFVAVEWPFADFLLSKASQNRFFATNVFDYGAPPWSYDVRRVFLDPIHGLELWSALLWAVLWAMASTGVGIAMGRWMQEVRR